MGTNMKMLAKISGFKKVLELMKAGRAEEALALQKGLQDQFIALWEENDALRSQLSEVAEILDLSQCMTFDGHMYWLEDEGQREGPYCQVCYDRDGELVRLGDHEHHWECKGCGNLYMKTQTKPSVHLSMAPEEEAGSKPLKAPIPLFAKS